MGSPRALLFAARLRVSSSELFEDGQKIATAGNAKSIAMLTSEGVRVPACYPARAGDDSWLAVEKSSISTVERADLISQ